MIHCLLQDNETLEDIQNELPASQPRFLVYSYCHDHGDGRKSYPMCFIFISPVGKFVRLY